LPWNKKKKDNNQTLPTKEGIEGSKDAKNKIDEGA